MLQTSTVEKETFALLKVLMADNMLLIQDRLKNMVKDIDKVFDTLPVKSNQSYDENTKN
jgi:3-methyladenine DNA glycosylase AlkC